MESTGAKSDSGRPPHKLVANLLDVGAVAEMLGCSTRHIYRLSDAGKMPRPVKLGALVRWRRSTGDFRTGIEEWIVAGCPVCRRGASL